MASALKMASLVAQTVKNPPAVQVTWVRSLGWEDPVEKEMASHSSILAWRTPWTEEPGGLQSVGSQRVRHDRVTEHSAFHCVCAMDTAHLLCPLTPQWALRLSPYIDSWLHVPFLQKDVDMSTASYRAG